MVELVEWKEEWKYASRESGALFAMILGTTLMLKLFADNLDMVYLVC